MTKIKDADRIAFSDRIDEKNILARARSINPKSCIMLSLCPISCAFYAKKLTIIVRASSKGMRRERISFSTPLEE